MCLSNNNVRTNKQKLYLSNYTHVISETLRLVIGVLSHIPCQVIKVDLKLYVKWSYLPNYLMKS